MEIENERSIIVRYIPEYIVVETQLKSFCSEEAHNDTFKTIESAIDNSKNDLHVFYDCLQDIPFEHIESIDQSTVVDDPVDDGDTLDIKQLEHYEISSSNFADTTIVMHTRKYKSKTSKLLNEWFFSHLQNPYPTEEEKKYLSLQTNMTKLQVNNWFINKRKRNKHLFDSVKETVRKSELEVNVEQDEPGDEPTFDMDDLKSTTVKLEVIIQSNKVKKRRRRKATSEAENLPAVCDVCGKTFSHRYMLQSHLKRHDPSKWDKCKICDKRFPDGLKRHMRVHSGERPYVCDQCGAAYKQAYGLTMHKTLHDNSGQLFYCDICNNGKGYRNKYALKDHLKLHYHVRNNDSTMALSKSTWKAQKVCTVCGFETYNMKSHMTARHSTLRPFICEICSETFKFKKDLQTHYAYHSDEMNFECDQCEKRFKTKRKLVIHKRIHSSEKLYKCNVCDKSFLVSTYLTKHMRSHTGEKKRHACTECRKDYSGITDLRRHLEREHGIKVQPNPKYSNNNMTKKYKIA